MINSKTTKIFYVKCDTEKCPARSNVFLSLFEVEVWIRENHWLEAKSPTAGVIAHLCIPCSQEMQKIDMETQLRK